MKQKKIQRVDHAGRSCPANLYRPFRLRPAQTTVIQAISDYEIRGMENADRSTVTGNSCISGLCRSVTMRMDAGKPLLRFLDEIKYGQVVIHTISSMMMISRLRTGTLQLAPSMTISPFDRVPS